MGKNSIPVSVELRYFALVVECGCLKSANGCRDRWSSLEIKCVAYSEWAVLLKFELTCLCPAARQVLGLASASPRSQSKLAPAACQPTPYCQLGPLISTRIAHPHAER